ncbi:MAG: YncE family protein, partial [Terriglobales bacterium]
MRRMLCCCLFLALAAAALPAQAPASGPYQVLKTANVGGEGGWDYIFADSAGRRLYIPRGATRETPATATAAAIPASSNRITIFDLDTLAPLGEIPDTGGNGVAVCPGTGHGFASSHPQVSMFDTTTMALIKKIDVGDARPDGIYCDTYNDRVYVFSHPTKNATVIDAKTGDVVGTVDLGGTPEEGVADGKGTLYVVMQDRPGSVAVVDVKTMKTTAHYPFGENGGCNGLALDVKNHVLFAACAEPTGTMVMLDANTGKILDSLPIGAGTDGATFNPATM